MRATKKALREALRDVAPEHVTLIFKGHMQPTAVQERLSF